MGAAMRGPGPDDRRIDCKGKTGIRKRAVGHPSGNGKTSPRPGRCRGVCPGYGVAPSAASPGVAMTMPPPAGSGRGNRDKARERGDLEPQATVHKAVNGWTFMPAGAV